MTRHKSLKRLVRDRMSRTNESYTTAHRNLTAANRGEPQPRPDGVVPGYAGFAGGVHEPSTLARALYGQSGVEFSEAMACGLGGGIGFLYAVFEYKQVDHPLLTIVAQHHPQPWLDAVSVHLGVSITTVTSSTQKAALGKLTGIIDAGTPAQLTVGRGQLPWHSRLGEEEAADAFPIIVAGRTGDEFVIDDGTPEPHLLSAAGLAVAWSAHRSGRLSITTVDRPASGVNLIAAIPRAIATTVAHLTGPVIGRAFDVNFGLNGMSRLTADVRNTSTRTGWTRRFASDTAFAACMSRLAECLTWAHSAPGGTRPIYADFLAEAGSLTRLELGAAEAAAREAGARWQRLRTSPQRPPSSDAAPRSSTWRTGSTRRSASNVTSRRL